MAIKVTTKIKEILKKRDARILSGTEYVQGLLAEVKKEILAELAATPSDSYSAFYLRQSLASIEKHLSAFESAADRELGAGISATWQEGEEMLPAVAQVAGESGIRSGFGQLSGNVLDTLKEFAFSRVTKLSNFAFTEIKGQLTLGILGQKTPQQVAAEIAGSLAGPSIFKTIGERAEVITGLEMGRSFSIANQKSMEQAADTLPDMQRMWLHAGHPRMPRQVHLLMHGQVRGIGNPFYQAADGTPVMYPRDPGAPIQEVIRCGCTHVPYMASWGDAKTFAASWDQAQYQASYKKAA